MRVIEVWPFVDKIPKDAKYLFHILMENPVVESEEDKNKRIISGEISNQTLQFPRVFYEISDESFQKLMNEGFFKRSFNQMVEKFVHEINK